MKLKHNEITIPEENPFANCKLAREPYARILSDIVRSYTDGFVLALNNDWGTGKTTFIKMWQQMMINDGYQVIYFNAWENDFDNNFLVAFISELKEIIKNKDNYKSLISKSTILVKHLVPSIIKAILSKHLDSKNLMESLENVLKGCTEIFENEVKEYSEKKQSIIDFRSHLEKYINDSNNGKPLIFIIDELDRCRPNYSVEVLEQIKHLFSVSGIVFVMSIDKKHLSSAIKGYYGCDKIDTDDYLRRFIDLEYSLPSPSAEVYINYLYDYYGFDDYFMNPNKQNNQQFKLNKSGFKEIAMAIFINIKPSLRVLEKVFSLSRLVLCTFDENQVSLPYLVYLLVFIKVTNDELYHKIEENRLSLQELSDIFFSYVYTKEKIDYSMSVLYMEAELLVLYNCNLGNNIDNLLTQDEKNNYVSSIASKLEIEIRKVVNESLTNCLCDIRNRGFRCSLSLVYLLNKINLIQPIINKEHNNAE